jgi:endonuclease III
MKLLTCFPQTFSEELGIDLASRSEGEAFKWFLASLLFGARISSKIAAKTYKQFEAYELVTPEAIQKAGWNRLVEVLDEGGYARYDYKTADMLLDITKKLQEQYDGKILNLIEEAATYEELETALKEFKGVGPVTVNIFLREPRNVWPKANPPLQRFVILAARHLNLIKTDSPRKALKQLEQNWKENKIKGKSFVHLENSLLRFGKDYCTEEKCDLSILEKND